MIADIKKLFVYNFIAVFCLAVSADAFAAGIHQSTAADPANHWDNRNNLVTSYRVDYDILSWAQTVGSMGGFLNWAFGTTIVPTAIGSSVELDSQYDWAMTTAAFGVVSSLMTQQYVHGVLDVVDIVTYGVLCHGMSQVIYGMECRR